MAESGTRSSLGNALFAYAGDISMLPLLVSQSGSEYLSETMEVQFTPEIESLATALENDPVKIYEYVRNNFGFEPYYGSLKGAQETFYEKAGNDFDLASLLISLLRTSGIKSRYVYGEIIVPIDKAMGWLGVLDPWVAGNIFATMGVPARMLVVGGKPYGLRMEHCWVEAYIPWIGEKVYLGAGEGENAEWKWVKLDPSYKQYKYKEGISLSDSVSLDTEGVIEDVRSTANIDTSLGSVTDLDTSLISQKMNDYVSEVRGWIVENISDTTKLEEYLPHNRLIEKEYGILGGTLPYDITDGSSKFKEIQNDKRHKITFELMDENEMIDFSYTACVPELAGKRITLSYEPASENDKDILMQYEHDIPAYLVKTIPEIRIEGKVEVEGNIIGLGQSQIFKLKIQSPNGKAENVVNTIKSGSFNCISLNMQEVSHSIIKERKRKLSEIKEALDKEQYSALAEDDVLGEILYIVGLEYFYALKQTREISLNQLEMISCRFLSEAITSLDIKVSELFGIPLNVNSSSVMIDVDRNVETPFPINGKNILDKQRKYMIVSGMEASFLEGEILEKSFSTDENPREAISAVKALAMANNQGIPLYTVTKENLTSIIPQLQISSSTINCIRNAVEVGSIAIVPASNINYQGWIGVGYIIMNPNTGETAYMISGGLAGGALLEKILDVVNFLLSICPFCPGWATTLVVVKDLILIIMADMHIGEKITLVAMEYILVIFAALINLAIADLILSPSKVEGVILLAISLIFFYLFYYIFNYMYDTFEKEPTTGEQHEGI